ncbi:MAG: glycoside hydrolase family 13 protein [Eggerthellaceae bacterium]|nr:glycoside hydrolase family 13 protein [Eggerthellaceae bacterium]
MAGIDELKWCISHDPCRVGDRLPLGAVPIGASVQVSLRANGLARTLVDSVDVHIAEHDEVRCERIEVHNGRFNASLELLSEAHVAWYCFEISCADETTLWYVPKQDGRSTSGELVDEKPDVTSWFQISVFAPGFETPEWFSGAVMYQAFPDRFARGSGGVRAEGVRYHEDMGRPVHLRNSWDEGIGWEEGRPYDPVDFFGGTLEGVRQKLGYLASLGVEVLYLNPVFEARSNHRYDTADYERIDPLLGTNEEFEALVHEAREKGIAIVLDAVLSHTGDDSRYFNAKGAYAEPGAAQSESSAYHSWYDFTPQQDGAPYRCWWGDPSLPEVDERNHSWQHYVLGTILPMWIQSGAKGYRFDVADEIPDEVLRYIREAVKGADPEAVLIGEVWEDATTKVSYGEERTYALGDSLDSVMNYPLRDALLRFALGIIDAYQLATFLKLQASNYPPELYRCLMNLVSSHDVERIRSVLSAGKELRHLRREDQYATVKAITPEQDAHGAQLQKMVAGLQFALPGSPCIYYGDERGLHGGSDPFCRGTFPWSSYARAQRPDCGEDLTDCYRRLGAMRKKSKPLRYGTMSCMAINEDALCVVRAYEESDEVSLTATNRSSKPATLTVDLLSRDLALPEFACKVARETNRFSANEDGIVRLEVGAMCTRTVTL